QHDDEPADDARLRLDRDEPAGPGRCAGDRAGDVGHRPAPDQMRQRAKRCSMKRPNRISATPITPISRIMANTPEVSKVCDGFMINWPSPVALRKNSAATMPTRPRAIAWRTPVIV